MGRVDRHPFRARTLALRCVPGLFGLVLVGSACSRHDGEARAQTQIRQAKLEPASSPSRLGAISTVDVEGDARVLVAAGPAALHRPLVYLHGMCADPREDLEAWGGLAETHGTIVALTGDSPCGPDKPPGRTAWTTDVEKIDQRIEAAVAAVNRAHRSLLDRNDVVLIGESMGAARAEALAGRFDRYARLVLIGSPRAPSPDSLGRARAIATLAGEHEGQHLMKRGTRALESAGVPVRFWELPGATHGRYGPEGERVMAEAVEFVSSH